MKTIYIDDENDAVYFKRCALHAGIYSMHYTHEGMLLKPALQRYAHLNSVMIPFRLWENTEINEKADESA